MNFKNHLSAACLLLCGSLSQTSAQGNQTQARPTATIDSGTVIGTSTTLSVNQFLGIPYGTIPQRFSPATPASNLTASFDASRYGPGCIQQFNYPPIAQQIAKQLYNTPPPLGGISEDCLSLNIFAPSTPASSGGRSVIVFIPGGSFQFDNSALVVYDGSKFAASQDVVIVTINFRVGVFGFATSPELPVTQRNLGLLDQRLALDWVQRNIAKFGGDPKKVTIMGESAGAKSVELLVTSYNANNGSTIPFRAGIMESTYAYSPASTTIGSTRPWLALAAALNCSSQASNLTCLRSVNATLLNAMAEQLSLTFQLTADNITVPTQPVERRQSGNYSRVPLLIGTNAQEGSVFTLGTANFSTYLTNLLGPYPAVPQILAAYPINPPLIPDAWRQAAAFFTDFIFQCASARLVNQTAQSAGQTWRYFYNATFSNIQLVPGVNLGVYHASELPQVFGTYPSQNATTQQSSLSNTMMGIWGGFAKDPTAGVPWPAYGKAGNGTSTGGNISFSVGQLGNIGDTMGSGLTVVDARSLDTRCGLYSALYTDVA